MSKHSLIKAGVGLGLMASSLASIAQLQTFAEPMVFYKVDGSKVNYVAVLPNIADTNVLLLDLYQSGTISTWAFGLGAAVDAGAGGPSWSYEASVPAAAASSSVLAYSISGTRYNAAGESVSFGQSGNSANSVAFGTLSTWYGGGTAAISLAFAQTQTISSQVCNVTFHAKVDTDGNLRFGESASNWSISVSGFPTASASVSYRTKSGTVGSDTLGIASSDWNAVNRFTATSNFPTFSAFSVPNAVNGATNTVAVSALTKGNLCTNVYTSKTALNAAGNVIGGATGLVRLW